MSQTDADIETVREAIRHTGYAIVGGSWPAFERIVTRMRALEDEVAIHLASDECREPVRIELSE